MITEEALLNAITISLIIGVFIGILIGYFIGRIIGLNKMNAYISNQIKDSVLKYDDTNIKLWTKIKNLKH